MCDDCDGVRISMYVCIDGVVDETTSHNIISDSLLRRYFFLRGSGRAYVCHLVSCVFEVSMLPLKI
jgi:hypothetical protein